MSSIMHIEGFTPSEVAELTGVGTVLQRDHRRRFPEWVPQKAGHARFNLFQCLQMKFVGDAAGFGIGPSNAYSIGEWVAHSALYFALAESACIEGDLASEVTMPNPTTDDLQEYTARRVFSQGFGRPNIQPPEFAIVCSDGSDWFGPSVEAFLANMENENPCRGRPMLVLHLPSFAREIVAKLPRPAVRIFQGESK